MFFKVIPEFIRKRVKSKTFRLHHDGRIQERFVKFRMSIEDYNQNKYAFELILKGIQSQYENVEFEITDKELIIYVYRF